MSEEAEKGFKKLFDDARKAGGEEKEKEVRAVVSSLTTAVEKTVIYVITNVEKQVNKRFRSLHPMVVYDMYIKNVMIGIVITLSQKVNDKDFDKLLENFKEARKEGLEAMKKDENKT